MGKKLEENGLFESSRMMLPEHAAEIRRHRDVLKHRVKPELDEQQLEIISRELTESYMNQSEIMIVLFDRIEDREEVGVVTKIDQQLKRVRLQKVDDWDWINLADIMRVE
ncbi:YolD-like family protein [Paenibacillus albiflavus]|nr:YolD-like family protein [Paenibacillus albiflavus]